MIGDSGLCNKQTGMELDSDLPDGWTTGKFKHFVAFQEGPGILADDFCEEGVPLLRIRNLTPGRATLNGCGFVSEKKACTKWKHFRVRKGDILISCSATTGIVSVVDDECVGAIPYTGIIRMWPLPSRSVPGFIRHFVVSRPFLDQIDSLKSGVAIQHYGPAHLNAVRLVFPGLDVQQSIADFLDRKIAKIDTLIAKKQRLIELLHEKRTALISHVVTKGLDPGVPIKESGIAWIGVIPCHWQVKKLGYISRRIDVGIAEAATHAYCDGGVPIIRSTNLRVNRIDQSEVLTIEPWFAEKNRSKYLYEGDLVTVRTGNAGVTAVVPKELNRSQCFTLLMTTLRSSHLPQFYSYYLNADPGRTHFFLEGWGTAQVNISVPILRDAIVTVPPADEQAAIVRYLDQSMGRLGALEGTVRDGIERLTEYRTALISAAVTGKIDVRREVV